MTNEEVVKEFNNFLKEKNIFLKYYPIHYPIMNKWDLTKYQYNPHKKEMFDVIKKLIFRRFKDDSASV